MELASYFLTQSKRILGREELDNEPLLPDPPATSVNPVAASPGPACKLGELTPLCKIDIVLYLVLQRP